MSWRLAHSLEILREQINTLSPNRSKSSDGSIGDTSHSARKSDHNPNRAGVVCAIDITHDPAHGVDCNKLATALVASMDRRIKYLIWNRRICSASVSPWVWRSYNGANPHNKHLHISVVPDDDLYDETRLWRLDDVAPTDAEKDAPVQEHLPALKRGNKGPDVEELQKLLNKGNAPKAQIKVDGDFGRLTETAVRVFQASHNLVTDGVVGSYTWDALLKEEIVVGAPSSPKSAVKKIPASVVFQHNIRATEFGGKGDTNVSAYDGIVDPNKMGVALPDRFEGARPLVRVVHGDKAVDCEIVDVGPWNTNDPYWTTGDRPQSEAGIDMRGRKTNKAGIDLTPAVMNALGVPGKPGLRSALVDWAFVKED